MNKIIATLLMGTMVVTMVGCNATGAKELEGSAQVQTTRLADVDQSIQIDEGELLIGKIIASSLEKDEKGQEYRVVDIEPLFGQFEGRVQIIVNKETVLENDTSVGFPKDYLISVYYDKSEINKTEAGKSIVTANVLSAVEEDQVMTIDPIEEGEMKDLEMLPTENKNSLEQVKEAQGELFIGQIVSSTVVKDKDGNTVARIKTKGLFGLSEEVEVIINEKTTMNNLTVKGYPKDYLISIFYDKGNLVEASNGQSARITAKLVSAVEEDKVAYTMPIEIDKNVKIEGNK